MPRVNRSEFIDARRSQRIDLNAARADPAFRARVAAAGFSLDDLDRLDLGARDGQLQGPDELRALFDLLKGLERGGPADTLTVKPNGWAASNVDRAFDAFESRFEAAPAPSTRPGTIDAAARARMPLSGAVGPGLPNRREDVRALQARLKEVGFDVGVDGQFGRQTQSALSTYRAMVTGTELTRDAPGRLQPNDAVDYALTRADPPRWERMPRSGPGFTNDDTDGFGYGSSETKLAIQEFGEAYARDYLAAHPSATPISVNDVSERFGGKNRDHETHQNGLDLDLRLPRSDGASGSDVRWANYDRESAWAMISAIAANPRVERILFSDRQLLTRAQNSGAVWAAKLQDGGTGHRNHLHVDIKAPAIAPG